MRRIEAFWDNLIKGLNPTLINKKVLCIN